MTNFPDFKTRPNDSVFRESHWDEVLLEYKEQLKKNTCSTCAYFRLGSGIYPSCTSPQNLGGIEKNLPMEHLGDYGWCKKKTSSNKWRRHPVFSLKARIDHLEDLNKFQEKDYYEVYQHFTGETEEVKDGWFKKKKVQKCFYYILKNGVGYFCTEYDYLLEETIKGFVTLNDFAKVWKKCLVTFSTPEEAIRKCELFNSWGNKHGNLVFSTSDPLESRFRELESKQPKKKV